MMAATTTIPAGPLASSSLAGYNDGNQTIADYIIVRGWISEPSVRGTWSLLYSCLFTIGICVWTCIHPNIPQMGKTRGAIFIKKVKWVAIALLAPEVVLATSLSQFRQATQLRSKLNATGAGQRYDLTFCYYVVMGGFVVDVAHLLESEHIVSLTADAIVKIQEADKADCLEITSDAIQDRSKADVLAKVLAVCQITWVVVQSIARSREHLPLTLLEVHTMVHVVSAIFMYLCWWYKPKDVTSTTKINPANIETELRSMCKEVKEDNTAKLVLDDDFYETRAKNFLDFGNRSGNDERIRMFGPIVLSLVYAAIHMTVSAQWGARGHYFPTSIEAKLWDAANYTIFGAIGTILVAMILALFLERFFDPYGEDLIVYSCVIMVLAIIVAKLYVTVESFVSLRAVPLAAYAVPSWTLFLPHF